MLNKYLIRQNVKQINKNKYWRLINENKPVFLLLKHGIYLFVKIENFSVSVGFFSVGVLCFDRK